MQLNGYGIDLCLLESQNYQEATCMKHRIDRVVAKPKKMQLGSAPIVFIKPANDMTRNTSDGVPRIR